MPKFEVVWFDANGVKQVDRFMTAAQAEAMKSALRYYNVRVL